MERKIIDFKVVQAKTLEDYQNEINSKQRYNWYLGNSEEPIPEPIYETVQGLNTKIAELIKEGYKPYGKIKLINDIHRSKSFWPAPDLSQETVTTTTYWVREFVKYETL